MNLIDRVIEKLGFDPNTHDPTHCWPWPGPNQDAKSRRSIFGPKLRPYIKVGRSTQYVLRHLVQYVNPHQELHPYYKVRPCPETPTCVNPFHTRVYTVKSWAPYVFDQRKYLFDSEFDYQLRELGEQAMRELYPLNFWEPANGQDPDRDD